MKAKLVVLFVVAISAGSAFARSSEPVNLPQLPGYEAVPLHYGPLNRMVVTVTVNGFKADFLVDTGAGLSVIGAGEAKAFGVHQSRPTRNLGSGRV